MKRKDVAVQERALNMHRAAVRRNATRRAALGEPPELLQQPKRYNKRMVSEAIKKSGGFISFAARRLKCSPTTIQKYLKKHPDLRELITEIREGHLDIAESSLMSQISKENTAATIFMLKCLGKKRGYIENPQIQLHAHAEAGSGTWIDIMKRAMATGELDPMNDTHIIDIQAEKKRLADG